MGLVVNQNVGAGVGQVGWWSETTSGSTIDLPSWVRKGDLVVAVCFKTTGSTPFSAPSGSWSNVISKDMTSIFGAGRLDIFKYTYAIGDTLTGLVFTPASATVMVLGIVRSDQVSGGSIGITTQVTDDTNTADVTITVPSLAVTHKNTTLRWLIGLTTNTSFQVTAPTTEPASADNIFGAPWVAAENPGAAGWGLRIYTKPDPAYLDSNSQAWTTGGTAKVTVIQMNFDDGTDIPYNANQRDTFRAVVPIVGTGLDQVVVGTTPGSGSGISVY